jgi:hypothetical protein
MKRRGGMKTKIISWFTVFSITMAILAGWGYCAETMEGEKGEWEIVDIDEVWEYQVFFRAKFAKSLEDYVIRCMNVTFGTGFLLCNAAKLVRQKSGKTSIHGTVFVPMDQVTYIIKRKAWK